MTTIDNILTYAKTTLCELPYKWYTGNPTLDGDDPFHTKKTPSVELMVRDGINCAAFINILRKYSGHSIPPSPTTTTTTTTPYPRGGTGFWCKFFMDANTLNTFDYAKKYPLGTLFLRPPHPVDITDQGHCAVFAEYYKEDPTKTLYGKIIHAYPDGEFGSIGRVGTTNLGVSHFYNQTGVYDTGYYKYAVFPQDWLWLTPLVEQRIIHEYTT